jgi:hypothetical protein
MCASVAECYLLYIKMHGENSVKKCTYIVSYVGVTVLLQAVPDDDNTRGSKHVGLTYNDCDL